MVSSRHSGKMFIMFAIPFSPFFRDHVSGDPEEILDMHFVGMLLVLGNVSYVPPLEVDEVD